MLQQDVGWTTGAGFDPVALVKKYPGRTKTTHFRAKLARGTNGKKHFIGEAMIDWNSLIIACEEVGGADWFTVEQEDYPEGLTPMECIERSLKGLKKILKEMGNE